MGIGIVAVLLAEWVATLARYESEQLDQKRRNIYARALNHGRCPSRTDRDSLDLGTLATAEVTSETKDHPLESALLKRDLRWRAAQPGTQITANSKTFLAGLRGDREGVYAGVCFCEGLPIFGPFFPRGCAAAMEFQPAETIREVQDYAVDLSDVTVVELEIVPDKRGGEARATVESLRSAA